MRGTSVRGEPAITMTVNEREYRVLRLLGKGKGGYSYLVSDEKGEYVLKQIHHEPCAYYSFGNKLGSELRDYQRLKEVNVTMPAMLDVDVAQERILKEYIDGDTVFELVLQDRLDYGLVEQMEQLCGVLYAAGINIDYFPTNFVVNGGKLYYIDFECNNYDPQWNFENWGIHYWSKTPEFLQYVKEKEIGPDQK